MMHPSTQKLVDKLFEMTRQRKVGWAEGEHGTVHYETEGYRVVLDREAKAVRLTDVAGKSLEDVTLEELGQTPAESGGSYERVFDEFAREAARQARGTEQAIDTVLAGLGGGAPGRPEVETSADAAAPAGLSHPEPGRLEDNADESQAASEAVPDATPEPAADAISPEPPAGDDVSTMTSAVASLAGASEAGEPAAAESEEAAETAPPAWAATSAEPEAQAGSGVETETDTVLAGLGGGAPGRPEVETSAEAAAPAGLSHPEPGRLEENADESQAASEAGPDASPEPAPSETDNPPFTMKPGVGNGLLSAGLAPDGLASGLSSQLVEDQPAAGDEDEPASEPVDMAAPAAEDAATHISPIIDATEEPSLADAAGDAAEGLAETTEATAEELAARAADVAETVSDAVETVEETVDTAAEQLTEAAEDAASGASAFTGGLTERAQSVAAALTGTPESSETPEETETSAAEDEVDEEPAPKPKPITRFNPWN